MEPGGTRFNPTGTGGSETGPLEDRGNRGGGRMQRQREEEERRGMREGGGRVTRTAPTWEGEPARSWTSAGTAPSLQMASAFEWESARRVSALTASPVISGVRPVDTKRTIKGSAPASRIASRFLLVPAGCRNGESMWAIISGDASRGAEEKRRVRLWKGGSSSEITKAEKRRRWRVGRGKAGRNEEMEEKRRLGRRSDKGNSRKKRGQRTVRTLRETCCSRLQIFTTSNRQAPHSRNTSPTTPTALMNPQNTRTVEPLHNPSASITEAGWQTVPGPSKLQCRCFGGRGTDSRVHVPCPAFSVLPSPSFPPARSLPLGGRDALGTKPMRS